MNKDIIYIDVEDDITAVIGKVKGAKEKIVALVPPKRIGILQSAVNLHLLARAARQSDKHLVLISNNSALMALAAAAKIPVAKNLQSKPEMAEISALEIDDGEDVIDGAQLPVGEHAQMAPMAPIPVKASDSIIDQALKENAAETMPKAAPPPPGKNLAKPKVKVPNFNKFRKKMVFIIGGGILFLLFLVWAIFFAPRATVQITARTTDSSVNARINFSSEVDTKLATGTIKAVTEQVKKDASVEFEATGKEEKGEKATGTMTLSQSGDSDPIDIPAGSSFTSGGLAFVTTEYAQVPGATLSSGTIVPGTTEVAVKASAIGSEYNLSPRSYQSSVSGVSARGSTMSGGSKETVKIVTAQDVQKAKENLADQDTDSAKKQLESQFNDSMMVIDETFDTSFGDVVITPGVGEEASGKAKISSKVTYALTALDKNESSRYLDEYFAKQLEGKDDQRVYDNGAGAVSFTNVSKGDDGFSAAITATAKIGPKINDDEIKELAKGKRYGEIQSAIESKPGVEDVDIKYWPFWVSVAPNDTKRISIEFKLNESK